MDKNSVTPIEQSASISLYQNNEYFKNDVNKVKLHVSRAERRANNIIHVPLTGVLLMSTKVSITDIASCNF